jgi:hypothetical protein
LLLPYQALIVIARRGFAITKEPCCSRSFKAMFWGLLLLRWLLFVLVVYGAYMQANGFFVVFIIGARHF